MPTPIAQQIQTTNASRPRDTSNGYTMEVAEDGGLLMNSTNGTGYRVPMEVMLDLYRFIKRNWL